MKITKNPEIKEFLKSKVLPIATVGTAVLSLAGCTVANVSNNRSFVFSCPPEAPAPKLGSAEYTDLPGPRDRLEMDVSCVDGSGGETAPTRIDQRSDSFNSSTDGERQYIFGVEFGVDIAEDPAVIEPINFNDPGNPNSAVITIEGMVNFTGPTEPELISQSG